MAEKKSEKQKLEQSTQRPWHFARWILSILYSPRRTFQEIVKNPDIKGPLLLLILISSVTAGTLYISGSKLLVVTATPKNDGWTEPKAMPLWNSNGNISFDENDILIGNTSVTSSISNGLTLWMNLTNVGEFNCTAGNFEVLVFHMKWTNPSNATPNSALLSLFSGENNSTFELDIIDLIPNSSDQWINLVIDIGLKNMNFTEINFPEWTNITGLEFLLTWTDSAAKATVKIDALYFGKYVLLAGTRFFEIFVSSFAILTIFDFFLKWLLFSVGLWLIIGLTGQKSSFKNLLYTTGYCLSGLIIYVLIRFFSFLLISPIKSFDTLVTYALLVSIFIFNVWPIVLGAFSLKEIYAFSRQKALLLSISAYLVYFIVAIVFVFGISFDRALFALP